MDFPLGYFLTWTCYGTRLHGDERGTVDRDHNRYGTPVLGFSPLRKRRTEDSLNHPPFMLGPPAREVVHAAIVRHIEFRRWSLYAINVRSNHVHVVLAARGYEPDPVMEQLKGWATRDLRDRGIASRGRPVWTVGGSTGWLWTAQDVHAACDYVTNFQ